MARPESDRDQGPSSESAERSGNDPMRRLLHLIDDALAPIANGEFLDLYHLGRSALVWRYQATFSTKDIDFVAMRTRLEKNAIEQFGIDSVGAKQLGLYIDFVPEGLPPLPQGYKSRSTLVAGDWKVVRLWELEVHDLASTKLKTFRPQDRQDLRFLCDRSLLEPAKLRHALENAFYWTMEKDGDDDRDRAFANLEIVIAYLEGRSINL